jgi:methylated-DNA-protein-cysteine methyltransferase-like protein
MKKKAAKKKPVKKKLRPESKKGTDYTFFENVFDVARLIPRGRITSYGAIAKYLGTGRSARMVGYAMNSCGTQIPPIPAHRVLNRNGQLTGKHHFSPASLMQTLLEKEGVKVKNDKVLDFEKVFWDPAEHLIF